MTLIEFCSFFIRHRAAIGISKRKVEANTFKRLKQGSLISPNGCFLSATGLVLVLLLLLGFISLLVLLARLVCLLTLVALLVGAAVEEIHFRKSLIYFHKDACQLLMVDVI